MSSDTPSAVAAQMGTTGTPSVCAIFCTSILPPFPVSSSIMLSARTVGTRSVRSCRVKYRLRSRFVASTMLMIPSGFWLRIKSRVTISSAVYGRSE